MKKAKLKKSFLGLVLSLSMVLSLLLSPALADEQIVNAESLGDANAYVQLEMAKRQLYEDYQVNDYNGDQYIHYRPVKLRLDMSTDESLLLEDILLQTVATSFPSDNSDNYYINYSFYDPASKVFTFDAEFFMNDRSLLKLERENEYILDWAKNNRYQTDYEQTKAIHDFIVLKADYNDPEDEMSGDYTIYDASSILFGNGGVCQSYTVLFQKMMVASGQKAISLYTKDGTLDPRGHTWNMAYIDGSWKHIDLTNDDLGGSNYSYDFFLTGPEPLEGLDLIWNKRQEPKTMSWLKEPEPGPQPETSPDELKIKARRIWGEDRIKTGIALAKEYRPKAQTLILARGDNYADALSASLLSGELDAPILLSLAESSIEDEIRDEIIRSGVKEVLIIGGENSISPQVKKSIEEIDGVDRVERISGTNRYETSAMIAKFFLEQTGRKPEEVLIASGENFPDALAGSSVVAEFSYPILLSKKDSLPKESLEVLEELGVERASILGGENTIGKEVYRALADDLTNVDRLGGENRYETSVMIADKYLKDRQQAFLASGESFPDSLVIGGTGQGAPILLTGKNNLAKEVQSYLKDSSVSSLVVVGGENTIKDQALEVFASAN